MPALSPARASFFLAQQGLAGPDFEFHAHFSPLVQPPDALAASQRLITSIRREADALFISKLPTY